MCGIIGFCGYLDAKDELVKGLAELEYRGYDSAGIACYTDRGIEVIKSVGKVEVLKNKLPAKLESSCGIGHTRWATHGGVSEVNAHPHRSGNVTLIHNGIIENYHELAKELEGKGKVPVSQTDTEIAAMLLDSLYESNQGNVLETLRGAVERLEGAYAFCIMFADQKDVIYCIRKGSPLVCCSSEEGSVVASDMVALLRYSKEYFVLPEYQVAKVTKNTITVMDLDGTVVSPVMLSVHWDMSAAQKNGFKHYMLKEIHEQPEAIRRTIAPRMKKGEYLLPDFTEDGITDEVFRNTNHVVITACGTAMHAGMAGRILLEKLLRIPVNVEIASEFRYADPILDDKSLVILVSQSGETADTLAALRLAKEKGAKTLSIVNVKGSSIARESDYVLYTHAGPEIAVASTKAYTAQLTAFYLLAFRFAYAIGKKNEQEISYYMKGLDVLIVRFLPFVLFIILGLNIVCCYCGLDITVSYELHGNSALYALGLLLISLASKRYHCIWNRAMYVFLILVPTFNYIDSKFGFVPDKETYITLFHYAYGITAIITAYMAMRHFYVPKRKNKKRKN